MSVQLLGRPSLPVKIDRKRLRAVAAELARLLGCEGFDVGIKLASDTTVKSLNRRYRGINSATDVLSFPFFEDVTPSTFKHTAQTSPAEIGVGIGDIVIGAPYVLRQSQTRGIGIDDQLAVVLTHGMCHCVGYRHDTDEQWEEMRLKEESLLAALTVKFPIVDTAEVKERKTNSKMKDV
eukprot:CFRG3138T1